MSKNSNKSFIVKLIDSIVKISNKPLNYLFIVASLTSIIGLIFLKEWRLIGLGIISIFALMFLILIIFGNIVSLNNLIRNLNKNSVILGNVLGYLFIVFFNLIIVFIFCFSLYVWVYISYQGDGGIDLIPHLTLSWVVIVVPLRVMTNLAKRENNNLNTLFVIFAFLSMLIIPSLFFGIIIKIISLTILAIFVFIFLPIYFHKNESNSLLFDADKFSKIF